MEENKRALEERGDELLAEAQSLVEVERIAVCECVLKFLFDASILTTMV